MDMKSLASTSHERQT